ncbi:MAG: M20/M25/M40 family metallo-hydrolase, partial [Anaerolineales bacterium]
MTDTAQIDCAIQENLEHNLAELAELCAQPSIAAQNLGLEECAQLTAELLRRRGIEAEVIPTHGAPIVYGHRQGRSDRTLLFYNHYDVQPPEPLELWTTPPFEPQIRDGHMYARGVSDDKGHIICRLAALDTLLAVDDEQFTVGKACLGQ